MAVPRTVTSRSVQGRWTGKPVRDRRGPATVTGDAEAHAARESRSHWVATRDREGAEVGPEARRPPSDHKAEKPSWKGVARCTIPVRPVGRRRAADRGAERARAPPTSTCGSRAPDTLVPQTTVTTTAGLVHKDGDPAHRCSAASAGGALDRATGGDWGGRGARSDYEIQRSRASATPPRPATRPGPTGRSGSTTATPPWARARCSSGRRRGAVLPDCFGAGLRRADAAADRLGPQCRAAGPALRRARRRARGDLDANLTPHPERRPRARP